MKTSFAAVIVLLMSATPGLTATAASGEDVAPARGAELLKPFKMNMKQALVDGLEKGPVSAISVCKLEAPAIAASLSVDGVAMGRASHRLRNPSNTAPEWVAPIIEAYLEEGSARTAVLVPLDDDRTGYVEPIFTQALCLTCHGKTLAPEVAAAIAEQYPEDEATGFELDDLRGVFWVAYPADEKAD